MTLLLRLRSRLPVLLLLLLATVSAVAVAAPPRPALLLRHVNVLDAASGTIGRDRDLLVVDGRIRIIDDPGVVQAPADATVLELRGLWVVPGLIDAHTHLATLDAARRALESGVTTVRTAGVTGFPDVALREAVRAGELPGPDVLAAGIYVTPRIGDSALTDPRLRRYLNEPVDDPEALRALVRVNADHGVDWIKARGTERAGLPETDPREQTYTRAELRAVVDEAARHDLKVMAHAHGDEGIRAAVLAGVTSIEHGTYASEATLDLMVERGTWLVPTLSSVLSFGQPGDYADPRLFLRGQHLGPRRVAMVRRAYEKGIPIVVGVDSRYGPGSTARVGRAVTFMVETLGFPPLYAVQGATSRAAELLGVAERTGRIAEGHEADLMVIDSNPLERVRALQDPLVVISNGYLVLNRLPFGKD